MNETLEMIQNYAASGKYKRVPVSRELYADAFTPISVMRTLRAASRHCYLLESADEPTTVGKVFLPGLCTDNGNYVYGWKSSHP